MRTSRTEEEILTLLDEYDNSNMTVKEFAELYEISDATFYNWRNKYRSKSEVKEDGSGFASLEVVEYAGRSPQKLFARVGHVEIYEFVEAVYLKQLMS
jgi:transposase-like protein